MDMSGSFNNETFNITSRDSRERLGRIMTRLFEHWSLPAADQSSLLGVSRRSIARYRKGCPLAYRGEIKLRISLLLRIHKALRLLYPHNSDLVYQWISLNNEGFNAMRPLDKMKQGIDGLRHIAEYLERQLDY